MELRDNQLLKQSLYTNSLVNATFGSWKMLTKNRVKQVKWNQLIEKFKKIRAY